MLCQNKDVARSGFFFKDKTPKMIQSEMYYIKKMVTLMLMTEGEEQKRILPVPEENSGKRCFCFFKRF